jgi:hypothetical protein
MAGTCGDDGGDLGTMAWGRGEKLLMRDTGCGDDGGDLGEEGKSY